VPASVLRVLPEAALDLFRAEAWYRERSVRAADGFLVEVGRGFALIREALERWAIFRKGARRFVLERTPSASCIESKVRPFGSLQSRTRSDVRSTGEHSAHNR
jgi:hypothetical protein